MQAVPLLLSHVSGENLYPETQNPNPDLAAGGVWGFAFHQKNQRSIRKRPEPRPYAPD
jgi:hypothetical protein